MKYESMKVKASSHLDGRAVLCDCHVLPRSETGIPS